MILNNLGRFTAGFQQAFSYANWAFSATGQYVMQVFTAEEDMTITQFGMCVTSSSGTPPIRIAMWQYVKGYSMPNPPTTKTYTDANNISTTPGISTPTFTWWNLTTPQTITRGNTYAIGIESHSTWSGGLSVAQVHDQGKRDPLSISGLPFSFSNLGGTANRSAFRWGIASATKTYGYPTQEQTVNNVGSSTTNMFAGNSFTIPTTMGATCKLNGVLVPLSSANQGNFVTADMRLYNATSYPPTLITTRVLADGGVPSWNRAMFYDNGQVYFPFDTSQTLTTGVKYLVGFQNSGEPLALSRVTFNRAQDARCLADISTAGVDGNLTTNTWTESETFRWVMGLDVTEFTPTVGSSGGGPVVGGRLVN